MKVLAVLLMLVIAPTGAHAQHAAEQTARIETVIESITNAVDNRRFDELPRYYAQSVVADYSSLWGNEARTLRRDEISAAWAGFIPGFDTTRHTIREIAVRLDDHTAQATAQVRAAHWLNGEHWIIGGQYRFDFVLDDGRWVVSRWTFLLDREEGDRGLVDVAEERARQ